MPNQRNRDLTRPLASAALVLLLSACSGETINLGENTSGLGAPVSSCPAGAVVARNQADIDALAGCEVIDGDLSIVPFEGADLRPLASLREVRGGFEIGLAVLDENAPDADLFAIFALLDERWLFSLEGLEALERVGHLSIAGFSVDSLEPLSNLSGLTQNGGIQLIGSGIRDLAGLENVVGLQSIEINCTDLVSLSGLAFPDSMNAVLLTGPALKDLGEFDVIGVQALDISATGIENLDGLATLQVVGTLGIFGNPELVDLGALDTGLLSIDGLNISDNATLERLPELAALQRLGGLVIADNPLLRNVPSVPAIAESLASFVDLIELSRQDLLIFRTDGIDIRNNPSLEQLVLPAGLQAAGLVTIENNAALRNIALSDIAAIDFLSIANNAALESVDLGALATVDELAVSGNPALDLAVFDDVLTFSRELSVAPAGAP